MTRVVLLLLLFSGGTIVNQSAAEESRTSAPGDVWEGVIESLTRPFVVSVDFGKAVVRLDATGSSVFKLHVLPNDGHTVRFQTTVGQEVLLFEGNKQEEIIRGVVRFGNRELPFWLERLPDLTTARNRAEAWQQDLDVVVTRFLRYDRSFSASAKMALRERVDTLRRSVDTLSDQAIMVKLARAIALGGNTHSRLYLLRNRTEVRRLPIRVWWFKKDLHIVRATNDHVKLLGCQISKIGNKNVSVAAALVRGIDAGNNSWQRYMSTYFLTSPDILYGAGVISSPDEVSLTLSCSNRRRNVRLTPLPLRKEMAAVEAWWDLAPSYRDANVSFATALTPEKAPRYLRNPQKNYWYEYIPEYEAIYLQYNRSQEATNLLPMKDFTESLLREVEQKKPIALIFDLRFNTGGNLDVATPLLRTIAEKLGGVQKFVITGRATFSAGITHVVQLRQWAGARIIGERVGDTLDMWSEGGNLTLPNSKLTVHYANGFHAYSRKEYPEHRPYLLDLGVDSVAPEVLIEPTWIEYLAGKDPVLDAVVARIRHRPKA